MIYKDENGVLTEIYLDTFTKKEIAKLVSKLIRGKYILCDKAGNEQPHHLYIGCFDFKSEATAWSITAENLQKRLEDAEDNVCKQDCKYENIAYSVAVDNLEAKVKSLSQEYKELLELNKELIASSSSVAITLRLTQKALESQTKRAEYFKAKLIEDAYGKEATK